MRLIHDAILNLHVPFLDHFNPRGRSSYKNKRPKPYVVLSSANFSLSNAKDINEA